MGRNCSRAVATSVSRRALAVGSLVARLGGGVVPVLADGVGVTLADADADADAAGVGVVWGLPVWGSPPPPHPDRTHALSHVAVMAETAVREVISAPFLVFGALTLAAAGG